MTKKKATDAVEAIELERPRSGGSYVRQSDGTLKRTQFTEHASIGAPTSAADSEVAEPDQGAPSPQGGANAVGSATPPAEQEG